MLLLLGLLPGILLSHSGSLLSGIAVNHHHGKQSTANLAEQSRPPEHEVASGNQTAYAQRRDFATGKVAEEIAEHIQTSSQEIG